MDDRIAETLAHFRQAHIEGGPYLFRAETAFLSFLCTLSAVEALAGYRYSLEVEHSGKRFKRFVRDYFPQEYQPHLDRLWAFRNGMIHAFTPRQLSIVRGASRLHLTADASGTPILNAEDFFQAMVSAADKYIAELQQSEALQGVFLERLEDPGGGAIHVSVLGFGNAQ